MIPQARTTRFHKSTPNLSQQGGSKKGILDVPKVTCSKRPPSSSRPAAKHAITCSIACARESGEKGNHAITVTYQETTISFRYLQRYVASYTSRSFFFLWHTKKENRKIKPKTPIRKTLSVNASIGKMLSPSRAIMSLPNCLTRFFRRE